MRRHAVCVLVGIALVFAACSSEKSDGASSTSAAPVTTSLPGTSSTSSSSSSSPIPPVTPPPGQAAPCSLLSESALEAVGVPAGTATTVADQPDGTPPSTGCRWQSAPAVTLSVYYGRDPLEILALIRQQGPNGMDLTGIGQDAYYVSGVVFVDTGSQAFAINGNLTQDQLQSLAQNVLTNL